MARIQAGTDWLDIRHRFLFGRYYDPEQMGYGALRVLNEDRGHLTVYEFIVTAPEPRARSAQECGSG